MKFTKFTTLAFLFLIATFMSCNDDDNNIVTPITEPVPVSAATLLLNSIEEDGGIPYDANNPVLTFSDAENVFLPSVLGIDFRIDRNVVPAGPTVRLPLFQGWETLPNGTTREGYYIITEASDSDLARDLGVIYAPRMANAIGSGEFLTQMVIAKQMRMI